MLKSSLRYSIYKVQTRFPKKAFELYHTQFRLSRTFFEFFQTFSRRFSLVLAFASNSVILSHLFKLVKHFFRAFSKFFQLWSCVPSFRFSSHNFFSIPQQVSFVKNFFKVFPNFSRFRHYSAALADSLRILSYAFPFVKRKL